jgi:hypothetical protein
MADQAMEKSPRGTASPGPAFDDASWVSRHIDSTVAHPARRYDYWLGGKDHFPADRESGEAVAQVFPSIRTAVRENRRFLGRAVRFLAGPAGVDQFLDIGTGIPTADNTHEVAQRIAPSARVVYVDNDPIVLAHARALLTTGSGTGTTAYLDADLRDPQRILGDPVLKGALDLTRPIALMLIAVMQFISDEDAPYDIVRTLAEALPEGSYLAMSHPTNDYFPPETRQHITTMSGPVHGTYRPRSAEEFARFLAGYELVLPGVVPVSRWRADGEPLPRPTDTEVATYGAIARIK